MERILARGSGKGFVNTVEGRVCLPAASGLASREVGWVKHMVYCLARVIMYPRSSSCRKRLVTLYRVEITRINRLHMVAALASAAPCYANDYLRRAGCLTSLRRKRRTLIMKPRDHKPQRPYQSHRRYRTQEIITTTTLNIPPISLLLNFSTSNLPPSRS